MAYIPPHKRRPLDDGDGPARTSSPRPELLSPVSARNPNSRSRNAATQRFPGISYASNCVWKWFAVGLDDRSHLPPSVRLRAVPSESESVQQEVGKNLLALINSEIDEERSGEVRARVSESLWIQIAENVTRDLLSSFEHVRTDMESPGAAAMKPTLVARFGKIIFRSSSPESVTEALNSEDSLKRLKKHLNTNIPKSYMDYIVNEGAQITGLELKLEEDVYIVQLSDSSRLDAKITCKCRALGEDGKLEVFKVELTPLRYMVVDVSCLEENIDLRLLLNTKRETGYDPRDNDMQGIQDIIGAAVIDPAIKGGLRWPIGKEASGDRFTVIKTWRVKTKIYVNSTMKLKVRNCDRFDFVKSTGESAGEVCVHLKKVISKLKERDVDENMIKDMLKNDLKCLWGSFFNCESFLKW